MLTLPWINYCAIAAVQQLRELAALPQALHPVTDWQGVEAIISIRF
ncbi:hypothetical protein [Tunturibacter empetritectus]|uniref:Uncharacterized protein n=1 Tax=Tunturiibacter lichenicola TaxID=2051959 RepID=A0A7W8J8Q7_9BACT|nr:hypothetical protein [Edaphobacter lichenicola]MBB5343392.1 hypothetical protein [Edaphobacter lichenicola]